MALITHLEQTIRVVKRGNNIRHPKGVHSSWFGPVGLLSTHDDSDNTDFITKSEKITVNLLRRAELDT